MRPENLFSMSHARTPLGNSERGRRFAMLFGTALALWIVFFLLLPTDLPFDNDVNSYLGGAAALSAGHGYRFEPYLNLPPIRMYPPGYSIWLSLFWKNGQSISRNSHRLKIANWLAAGAALAGLAGCLFSSELPSWLGWILLISFGTSVLFTQLTGWLLSDVLFTAGTCSLALLVATYDSERSDRRLAVWWVLRQPAHRVALSAETGGPGVGGWIGSLWTLERRSSASVAPGLLCRSRFRGRVVLAGYNFAGLLESLERPLSSADYSSMLSA